MVDSATWLSRPGIVGEVIPDGQVKIGDDDGNLLPRAEVGTVYLKAPKPASSTSRPRRRPTPPTGAITPRSATSTTSGALN